MKFEALDKEYVVATKNHGKQTIQKGAFEVPQNETIDEVREFFGGDAGIIDATNDLIRSSAKNGAIAIVRNGAAETPFADLFSKAVEYAKSFTWSRERGPAKKEILAGVDHLKELSASGELASMSQEQLLALLQSSLKI